jgi:hypothetical protein
MKANKNISRLNSLKQQAGASFFVVILLLVIVGMVLLSALKVAPSYMDNNVIVNAMEGIINNNDFPNMSLSDIRSDLQRSLVTNSIRDFDLSNVVLTREGDDRYIDINYEARSPLFYNIEIVVVFENRFDKN